MVPNGNMHYRRILIALICISLGAPWMQAGRKGKHPTTLETETGREVVLTSDIKKILNKEIPDHRIPKDSDFNPKMLKWYYPQLIGIHPAVAWGDFNKDKKTDYALLVITGDTPWGPVVELVVLNGKKGKGQYDLHRLGEVYKFKDDYLSSKDGKLTKGRYQQGAWYINWSAKDKTYIIYKS
jgi:hypothetical protein